MIFYKIDDYTFTLLMNSVENLPQICEKEFNEFFPKEMHGMELKGKVLLLLHVFNSTLRKYIDNRLDDENIIVFDNFINKQNKDLISNNLHFGTKIVCTMTI